jgi:hypothetical protein
VHEDQDMWDRPRSGWAASRDAQQAFVGDKVSRCIPIGEGWGAPSNAANMSRLTPSMPYLFADPTVLDCPPSGGPQSYSALDLTDDATLWIDRGGL